MAKRLIIRHVQPGMAISHSAVSRHARSWMTPSVMTIWHILWQFHTSNCRTFHDLEAGEVLHGVQHRDGGGALLQVNVLRRALRPTVPRPGQQRSVGARRQRLH